jgi:hypothetical protein
MPMHVLRNTLDNLGLATTDMSASINELIHLGHVAHASVRYAQSAGW